MLINENNSTIVIIIKFKKDMILGEKDQGMRE